MLNLFEEAKRQDALRAVEEDEKVFRETGKNISYDDHEVDPLVPCGYYVEPEEPSLGQMAKRERQERYNREQEEKKRIEEERELIEAIEKYKNKFSDSTSYLEVV